MSDKGIIFLGNLMSFEMMRKFDEELALVGGKRRNKRDSWYPQWLIEAIPFYVDGIYKVECSPKISSIANELVKYRKDVLLFVYKANSATACNTVRAYSLLEKD